MRWDFLSPISPIWKPRDKDKVTWYPLRGGIGVVNMAHPPKGWGIVEVTPLLGPFSASKLKVRARGSGRQYIWFRLRIAETGEWVDTIRGHHIQVTVDEDWKTLETETGVGRKVDRIQMHCPAVGAWVDVDWLESS